MKPDPVSIMIYVDNPDDLPKYMEALTSLGFLETDWCELTHPDNQDRVMYGPCSRIPDKA